MLEYQNIDYRTIKGDTISTVIDTDPTHLLKCFGRSLTPYECIFIKSNRIVFYDNQNNFIDLIGLNSLTKYWFNKEAIL